MGKSDGGFEYDLRNKLNHYREINDELKEIGFLAERVPQTKYGDQFIDVKLTCKTSDYHSAFECKTKKIKGKTAKMYFSEYRFKQEQVDRIDNYLDRTRRNGYLALGFRRGRGKSVLQYIIPWPKFKEWWQDEDVNGISPEMAKENGYEITDDAIDFIESL